MAGSTFQVNVGTSNFSHAPTINLTADSAFNSLGAGQINCSGILAGTGNVLNVSSGASRLYMNGTVSSITQFNVIAGAMGFDLSSGNRGGGAPVVVSSGASLYIANATIVLANNLTLTGTGQVALGALFQEGNAAPMISGTITLAGPTSIGGNTAGANVTLTGQVTGGFALTKIGADTYTLSNANDNYSSTTIAAGVLAAGNSTALGSGAVGISAVSGAQLALSNGVNVGHALTIAGGGVTAQGALCVPTGSATYSGSINITGATQAGADFASSTGGLLTISGAITTSAGVPVTVRNGRVLFSGAESYTTGTTLGNAGATIQFGQITSMAATGSVSIVSGATLAASAGGTGEFTDGSGTSTAGTTGGLLHGVGGQGTLVNLPTGSLLGIDTTNAPAASVTYSTAITFSTNVSGGVGITKPGTGLLTLSSVSTYTGATTVARGTRNFSGGPGGDGHQRHPRDSQRHRHPRRLSRLSESRLRHRVGVQLLWHGQQPHVERHR